MVTELDSNKGIVVACSPSAKRSANKSEFSKYSNTISHRGSRVFPVSWPDSL